MVGLASYEKTQKEHWRRWQWNKIVEKLTAHLQYPWERRQVIRDACGVYLVGPDDLDREEALKRGFRNKNLIAVDIDEHRVRSVNERGGVAVCGNLADLLMFWPETMPLSFISADLCCGLTDYASHSLGTSINACRGLLGDKKIGGKSISTVACINLLRGRDPESNSIRLHHQNFGVEEKHRGALWFYEHLAGYAAMAKRLGSSDSDVLDELRLVWDIASPSYMTYRSGPQKFDSVVLRLFAWGRISRAEHEKAVTWYLERGSRSQGKMPNKFDRKSLAATLAACHARRNRLAD